MNKKDVLEIKRRMVKENCSFTRMCGCYVDAGKNKVTMFGRTFLNLDDGECYKYLDIAKGVLKGTLNDNLLNLPVEDEKGEMKRLMLGLRDSGLKNEKLLDTFYDAIIEDYDYAGDYLIVIFCDAYDVMVKTSDNNKLDESEEVYEYLLCAICPVALTKPGLAYSEKENDFMCRVRDKVVGAPCNGFIYPAFTDRAEDRDTMLFYTKDAREPHRELAQALGFAEKLTATEQRDKLKEIFEQVVGDSDEREKKYENFHRKLEENLEDTAKRELERSERQKLTIGILGKTLEVAGFQKEEIEYIQKRYREDFRETPEIASIIDEKAVKASISRDETEKMKRLLKRAGKEIEALNGGETELTEQIRMVAGK